jgi:hypothetical protein
LGKKTAFSTNGAGKTVYPHVEDRNWIPGFHPVLISVQSGSKTFNVRCETFKQLQERIGETLEPIVTGNDLPNDTPVAQQVRGRIDEWDCIKLKSFCATKEIVTRLKRPSAEWEKIFASCASDKGITARVYRKLEKLNSQRINNPPSK